MIIDKSVVNETILRYQPKYNEQVQQNSIVSELYELYWLFLEKLLNIQSSHIQK